jgi:hypothetical protein
MFFIGLANGKFDSPAFAILPAIGFGVAGVTLLLRGPRQRVNEIDAAAVEKMKRLEQSMAEMQVEIDNTQVAVKRLKEERAFMDRLLMERNGVAMLEETTTK